MLPGISVVSELSAALEVTEGTWDISTTVVSAVVVGVGIPIVGIVLAVGVPIVGIVLAIGIPVGVAAISVTEAAVTTDINHAAMASESINQSKLGNRLNGLDCRGHEVLSRIKILSRLIVALWSPPWLLWSEERLLISSVSELSLIKIALIHVLQKVLLPLGVLALPEIRVVVTADAVGLRILVALVARIWNMVSKVLTAVSVSIVDTATVLLSIPVDCSVVVDDD